MSQEKVAKYKEAKLNRKETMKKQKQARLVRNTVVAVVCLLVLGWVGYSAVDYYKTHKPRLNVEVDYSAVEDFAGNLSGNDTVEEESHEGHDHE